MSAKISAFRQQWPIYGAGLFSNSNITISSIIVPLWAIYLGVSPWLIGILLGARHLPGLLFAIHGGVLLDRLPQSRSLFPFFSRSCLGCGR